MTSPSSATPAIGYCTNVHPGVTLDEVGQNLSRYASAVRDALDRPAEKMPCGLWLNDGVARSLVAPGEIARFASLLDEHNLCVRSLNGFPMGDFHQPVVKHLVYQPAWNDRRRLEYTMQLAGMLARLLGDATTGSISTLPLGWRAENHSEAFFGQCATHLLEWVHHAIQLENSTGKRIRLALEPEPGCCLDKAGDVTGFFQKYVLPLADRSAVPVLEYLGVCHDICHSAVMFEPQHEAIQAYRSVGIPVWKVQVSSAIEVRFEDDSLQDGAESGLFRSLGAFEEPKFLHQTNTTGGEFFEDLPGALESAERTGIWRIHFHVPVFAAELGGGLATTQSEIGKCVELLKSTPGIDWEVETYAWGVLPKHLQPDSLVSGIAREIQWTSNLFLPASPGL